MKKKITDILIRTVKTMAQSAIGAIGTSAVLVSDVDWKVVLSTVCLSGIVCILMNIANE